MEGKHIPYIIAARLTQPLQRTIYQACGWWALEGGVELTEFRYQAAGWTTARRLIVVRQSVKRKTAPGKTLSLFADDAITQVIEELDWNDLGVMDQAIDHGDDATGVGEDL